MTMVTAILDAAENAFRNAISREYFIEHIWPDFFTFDGFGLVLFAEAFCVCVWWEAYMDGNTF